MRRLVAFLFVIAAVAGCIDDSNEDIPSLDAINDGTGTEWEAVELTVDEVEPLDGIIQDDGDVRYDWEITGVVDRPATVAVLPGCSPDCHVDGSVPAVEANGTFAITGAWFSIGAGEQRFTVAASSIGDNGTEDGISQTTYIPLTINFLAPATVTIDYGSTSDKGPVNDTVWVDIVDYPSQSQYDDAGVKHPEYANIHDAMAAWEEQQDHTIDYAYDSSIGGFSISRIDGEGNAIDAEDDAVGTRDPPYWCYTLNGESDGVQGITAQRFSSGDVIHWELGSCRNLGAMA